MGELVKNQCNIIYEYWHLKDIHTLVKKQYSTSRSSGMEPGTDNVALYPQTGLTRNPPCQSNILFLSETQAFLFCIINHLISRAELRDLGAAIHLCFQFQKFIMKTSFKMLFPSREHFKKYPSQFSPKFQFSGINIMSKHLTY